MRHVILAFYQNKQNACVCGSGYGDNIKAFLFSHSFLAARTRREFCINLAESLKKNITLWKANSHETYNEFFLPLFK